MWGSNQNHSQYSQWVTDHSLVTSAILYLLICVPAYAWLHGPVEGVGTIDSSVVIVGLAIGAIMGVPVIRSTIVTRFVLKPTERLRTEGK